MLCQNGNRFKYKRYAKSRILGSFDLFERIDCYEIWSLGVREDCRRKGVATKMLTEFIEQFSFDKPLVLFVQKGNYPAINLYKKVGFEFVDDDFDNRYQGIAYAMIYAKED